MSEQINGISVQDRVPMRFYPTNGNEVNSGDGRTASVFRDNATGWAWLYNPWTGELRDPRDIAADAFGLAIVPPTGCDDDHKALMCRASILDLLHLVEKSTCRFMAEADADAADIAINRIREYLSMGVMPRMGEERLLERPARVGSVVFGIGTPEHFVVDSAVRAYAYPEKESSVATNAKWVSFLQVMAASDEIYERIKKAMDDLYNMTGTDGVVDIVNEFISILNGEWPPEHVQELRSQEAEKEFAGERQ